jgi:dethiobiotin synthetase
MADPRSLTSVVLITGTGTEVGKTVATAALAAVVRARGSRVAVVKPAQTGLAPGEPGDVDEVRRLVGDDLETHELVRLRDPLSPEAAARHAGVRLAPVAAHAKRIGEIAAATEVVFVEGAGGLLVRLDERGGTLADLGSGLRYKGIGCGVVLVASAGLGTLNTAALTAEALAARSLPLLGVVIGSWPAAPGLAERSNVVDLPRVTGAPLWGAIPEGAGRMTRADFLAGVPTWFALDDHPT